MQHVATAAQHTPAFCNTERSTTIRPSEYGGDKPRARSPTTSVSSCLCGPRLGTTYGAVEREPVGSKFVEERRWLFLETTSELGSSERSA